MKCLLLDWGGVISNEFFSSYTKKTYGYLYLKGLRCSLVQYRQTLKMMEREYLMGKEDAHGFWHSVGEHFNLALVNEDFISLKNIFFSSNKTRKSTLNLLQNVPQGVKVGLLSNNYKELKPHINAVSHFFDFILLSCDYNMMKPNKNFFFIAYSECRKLLPSIEPSDIFFVDDKEKNVLAGKNFGFTAILYKNAHEIKKNLSTHQFDKIKHSV